MSTELSTLDLNVTQQIVDTLMSGEGHLSFSSLCAFKESPADFINYKLGKREETDAMLYGSMVHCLVLEPEDFDNRYYCIDDTDTCEKIGGAKPRATKAYKEWKSQIVLQAGERQVVETNDFLNAKIVASNVLHNRASRKILDICPEREVSIEWEYANFKFRGFIDLKGERASKKAGSKKVKADLKTCTDAAPDKVQRQIVYDSWYLQQVMYNEADPADENYIIAVDKKGGVSVHLLHPHLMAHGKEEYQKLLDGFNECILKDGFNQSYDFWAERWDGIYSAEKPAWLY